MAAVAVVGAGAIGRTYGALLAAAGHRVGFAARGDADRLARQGLTLRIHPEADGSRRDDVHLAPGAFTVAADTAGLAALGSWDWTLVAVKAVRGLDWGGLLRPLARSRLVIACNGLGVEDAVAAALPGADVYGLLCFTCANRAADGSVDLLAHGATAAGHHGDDPVRRTALADLIRSAGMPSAEPPCLLAARWRKLAWNIPFNGLAIRGGTPGRTVDRILAEPGLHAHARRLCRETVAVANADLARHGVGIEDDWIEEQFRRTAVMGDYRPSTLIDCRAGAPMEIDALFGEPARRAARLGVAAPAIAALAAELALLPGAS
jgi:2-dehydropantoate 2-reductase